MVLHRDLYDKQFVGHDGTVGLLDFDTLAVGEAALDIANILAHLELRVLQCRCTRAVAADAAAAFLDAYAPGAATIARLPAYLAASRVRLSHVYRFRPSTPPLVLAALQEAPPAWLPAASSRALAVAPRPVKG